MTHHSSLITVCLAWCLVLIPVLTGPAAEVLFETSQPIVEIEWRGKANLEQDEFLDLIGIQVGDTLQRRAIRRSLEKLYLKGFFSQIRIETTAVQEGLKLTYYTTPAATIQRYQISGNSALAKKSLLERLRPQVDDLFSEHRLKISLETLRQFYAEQGFPQATIAWRIEKSPDLTKATIFLDIDEGRPLVVEEIHLAGVTAFSPEDLLGTFKVRIGQPLSTERLSGDLERFGGRYRHHGYLAVRIEDPHMQRDLERDTAVVSITVVEGPKITLAFTGNRQISSKVLREAVAIDAIIGYREDALADSERAMMELYGVRGFPFATVSHEVEEEADDAALLLRFRITEGPQVTVKRLTVVGHQGLSETDIQAQFLTQARRVFGLLSKGLFIEKQLDRDLEAVQFLYRRHGFFKAHLSRELLFSEDRSQVSIHVTITEGPRTRVASIVTQGYETIAAAELLAQFTLQVGDPFDDGRAQESLERLLALYERRGYRDARITLDRRSEEDEGVVHLTYRIDEGRPTVIGDTIVHGNYRTRLEVITRDLTFRPGDPLSLTKLLESRRKLSQLTLFSRLSIDPLLEEVPGQRDVVIQVTERKPKALNFGAGYGSEDKLRGFVEFTHNNIAGMHREFRVRAQASFLEEKYLMNFREPRLVGTLISSTVGLARAEEEHDSFSVRRMSAQLGFERPLWDHYRAFLTYAFDIERLFDVESDAQISEVDRGRLNIAFFVGTIQRDTRDKVVGPRTGSVQRLTFEVADFLLGSEASFFKLIGTTQWFFPLPWQTMGAVSFRGGIAEPFGATGEVPISRRFFVGGTTTIRGYDFERLGPTGIRGAPTGGDVLVLANLEWRVPVYKSFGAVLFSDLGNVFRAIDDFSPGKIKGAVGLGLRYNTPIGPARLDYGRKFAPEDNEASGRFHFTLGHAF